MIPASPTLFLATYFLHSVCTLFVHVGNGNTRVIKKMYCYLVLHNLFFYGGPKSDDTEVKTWSRAFQRVKVSNKLCKISPPHFVFIVYRTRYLNRANFTRTMFTISAARCSLGRDQDKERVVLPEAKEGSCPTEGGMVGVGEGCAVDLTAPCCY